MGIEVVVEDEHGAKIASIEDPTNILHRLLPAFDDPEYQCLNRVDWYGDTTFNRYQISTVREELKRLANERKSAEELKLIHQIDVLVTRCESEPHLYLKFYGD
jgi:hypothetical protein